MSFDLNLRLENWGWDAGIREVVDRAVGSCDVLLGAGADEIGALAGIDDPVEAARSLAAITMAVTSSISSGKITHPVCCAAIGGKFWQPNGTSPVRHYAIGAVKRHGRGCADRWRGCGAFSRCGLNANGYRRCGWWMMRD